MTKKKVDELSVGTKVGYFTKAVYDKDRREADSKKATNPAEKEKLAHQAKRREQGIQRALADDVNQPVEESPPEYMLHGYGDERSPKGVRRFKLVQGGSVIDSFDSIDQAQKAWMGLPEHEKGKTKIREAKIQSGDIMAESANNRYGIRYKVFAGKSGTITTKEKWFKSAADLEKFAAKVEELGNFYEIDGYSYPPNDALGADKVNEDADGGGTSSSCIAAAPAQNLFKKPVKRTKTKESVMEDTNEQEAPLNFCQYILRNYPNLARDYEEVEDLFDFAYLDQIDPESVITEFYEGGHSLKKISKYLKDNVMFMLGHSNDKAEAKQYVKPAVEWIKYIAPKIEAYLVEINESVNEEQVNEISDQLAGNLLKGRMANKWYKRSIAADIDSTQDDIDAAGVADDKFYKAANAVGKRANRKYGMSRDPNSTIKGNTPMKGINAPKRLPFETNESYKNRLAQCIALVESKLNQLKLDESNGKRTFKVLVQYDGKKSGEVNSGTLTLKSCVDKQHAKNIAMYRANEKGWFNAKIVRVTEVKPQVTTEEQVNELDNGPKGRVQTDKINYDYRRGGNISPDKDQLAANKQDAKAEREERIQAKKAAQQQKTASSKPKINLDAVWQKIEQVVGDTCPDGDPIDWLAPWCDRVGISYENIDKACRKNGYKDLYAYYKEMIDYYNETTGNEDSYNPLA